jgi:hypothetical protein
MNMSSVRSRKVRFFIALLFATLVTGCFGGGPGWGGGNPGYYSNNYYPNNYYPNSSYRGYDSYPHPGTNRSIFGGYAPGNETWQASSRGRTSYGDHRDEGHGGGGDSGHHGGGDGAEHGNGDHGH